MMRLLARRGEKFAGFAFDLAQATAVEASGEQHAIELGEYHRIGAGSCVERGIRSVLKLFEGRRVCEFAHSGCVGPGNFRN